MLIIIKVWTLKIEQFGIARCEQQKTARSFNIFVVYLPHLE